jgi:replicative DNA helicase
MDKNFIQEVILGAVLLDRRGYDVAKSIVGQDDFIGSYKAVWSAFDSLNDKGLGIDLITATNELKSLNLLDSIGGAYFVADLTNKIASAGGIEDHCKILKEYSIKDQAHKLGIRLMEESSDKSSTDLMETIQKGLDQMQNKGSLRNSKKIAEVMALELHDRKNRKGGLIGVSSGMRDFDNFIGGIYTGVHVLAARPAMGKTAFAVSVAINAVDEIPVVFWSGEMTADKIFLRVESNLSGIPTERLRINEIHRSEDQDLQRAHLLIDRMNFTVDDTPNLNMNQLRVKAMSWKSKLGRFLLVMDYLGLMDDGGDEYKGVTSNSKRIHQLANELDLPILLLHQLNRSVESRDNKIPQLSDLRASGGIEQDADTVSFLYRPHYYKLERDPISGLETDASKAWIIVKKNREGKTGEVCARFEGHRSRYSDL